MYFLGVHWLPVTNKERSTFPSVDHFQGQLRTPLSVSVRTCIVNIPAIKRKSVIATTL